MVGRAKKQATPEAADVQDLVAQIPPIFAQVQQSLASHKKNVVALRKIQVACAQVTEEHDHSTSVKLIGEKAFNLVFIDMVNRVLQIKKGVAVADRVVQFVGKFATHMMAEAESAGDDSDEAETASRCLNKLIKHLLSGAQAKDKNIRYRVVQLIVALINGLSDMDEDMYLVLRDCMLERTADKEAAIRVQAVLGLSKLYAGDDDEDQPLEPVLLDLMRFDAAPEVRRAALYNLTLSPTTLPYVLERTRDTDATLRRTVFLGPLSKNSLPSARALSLAQREAAVKAGLGDRESGVRRATAAMLGDWLDQEDIGGDLLEFLGLFDVTNSAVAEEALLSILVTRAELLDSITFDDAFWQELTPEKALLARVFADNCVQAGDNDRLENTLPVVTALAFVIQEAFNSIVNGASDEMSDDGETSTTAREQTQAFLIAELCRLALHLDYADEIGRRKMFGLAREMLSHPDLSEVAVAPCMDVLTKIASSERDVIRIVVDVVTEMRLSGSEEPEQDHPSTGSSAASESASPGSRLRGVSTRSACLPPSTEVRCLEICIALLRNVNGTLQENAVFSGLVTDLIIPAMRSKDGTSRRELGLTCLGLCSMLDLNLAKQSFPLFVEQLSASEEAIQVKVACVVFDLLMLLDFDDFAPSREALVHLALHAIGQDSDPVRAVACEGVAKLLLSGKLYDDLLLQELILTYFSPDTADNLSLRQCLSYCLPAFCFSSSENQGRLSKLVIPIFRALADAAEDEQEGELLTLQQMGALLVDWTDPLKVIEREGAAKDENVHLHLALAFLQEIAADAHGPLTKTLIALLSKLHLPDDADGSSLVASIMAITQSVMEHQPPREAVSRNALVRLQKGLVKRYPQAADIVDDPSKLREMVNEEVVSLLDGLDGLARSGSESPVKIVKKPRARASTADDDDATSVRSQATSVATSDAGGSDQTRSETGDDNSDGASVDGMLD